MAANSFVRRVRAVVVLGLVGGTIARASFGSEPLGGAAAIDDVYLDPMKSS